MKTIKTLKQLNKLVNNVNVYQLLNGRINTIKNGWENVKVTEELRELTVKQFSEQFGGREKTKERMYRNILQGVEHWSTEKTYLTEIDGQLIFEYTPGQDHDYEQKQIRKELNK